MPRILKLILIPSVLAFFGLAFCFVNFYFIRPVHPGPLPFSSQSFLVGVNYPWVSYGNDFGDSFWGHEGVSSSATAKTVDKDFAELQKENINVVRWFLWADGHGGIHFNQDGSVQGLDHDFFADVDMALSIARRHNIRIVFVLVDFKFFEGEPYGQGGRNWGGHQVLVENARARQTFLDRAVRPLVERYANEPAIAAWEIVNEPEWEVGMSIRWGRQQFTVGQMQTFIASVAACIHHYGSQPVTVGSVDKSLLVLWSKVGLDFYEAHSYPYNDILDPLPPILFLGHLDKPCLLGEFPTSSGPASVNGYLDRAFRSGYAGAFAWSFRSNDGYSDYQSTRRAISNWKRNH